MKRIQLIRIAKMIITTCIIICFTQCDDNNVEFNDKVPTDDKKGTLEIQFNFPKFNHLPMDFVHRSSLCIGLSPDSIFQQKFIDCENVSDVKDTYKFRLDPGTYFYQAGITCSAPGDSCLWGGFPGGRMGIRWVLTRVIIESNKKTISVPIFQ